MKMSVAERRETIRRSLQSRDRLIIIQQYQEGVVHLIMTKHPKEADTIRKFIVKLLLKLEYSHMYSSEYDEGDENGWHCAALLADEGEDGFFNGNRLFDDLIAIDNDWHCAVVIHDKDVYNGVPALYRDYTGTLRTEYGYNPNIIKQKIEYALEEIQSNGYTIIAETELIGQDLWKGGTVPINESNIVQMATGEFVTHASCNVCGENAGCKMFDALEEAIRYRDSDGTICYECYTEELKATRECEYCLNESDCTFEKKNNNKGKCRKFEFNEYFNVDWEPNEEDCACPLGE